MGLLIFDIQYGKIYRTYVCFWIILKKGDKLQIKKEAEEYPRHKIEYGEYEGVRMERMSRHRGDLCFKGKVNRMKNSRSGILRAGMVAGIFLIKIVVIFILVYVLRQYTVYFYVFVEFLSFPMILFMMNDVRSPNYKLAWVAVCMLFPLSGQIMYMLWGRCGSNACINRRLGEVATHGEEYKEYGELLQEELQRIYPIRSRMSVFLETEGFPLTKNNQVQYFSMGAQAFASILSDIEKAECYIALQFFIVAEGELWSRIYNICLRKLAQGVKVLLLYDDFGTMLRTEREFADELRKQGFQVAVFNPIHKYTDKLYMNYRSHQKCVIIDGEIGYVGSFNIGDEYVNLVKRFGTWKDNGIRIVGEAVWCMTVNFLQMWEIAQERICMDYNEFRGKGTCEKGNVYCQVIADGPLNNPNNPIELLYLQMIQYAREYLYIMTPYLILDKDMLDALITAVKSGVDVKIITPFVPDKVSVKLVTSYNYGYLLQHGVRIFEYKPGFLHSKCILNEMSAVVGSINMDYRSFYLHYENGVWINNELVIDEIRKDFDHTLGQCREVMYEEWLARPLRIKVCQSVLNVFSTLL